MSTSMKVFKKGPAIKNKNTAISELVRTSKEMRKKNDGSVETLRELQVGPVV
ncbi:hypothetical protein [Halorhabdus rudnickae]|uniref:hypothetical protein n=1 Tax=Halorhabdus rudnickae TaxID=1775544 RepID=UPI0014384E10|nr:hypothetical protein [Halorhabdus rudnickae]